MTTAVAMRWSSVVDCPRKAVFAATCEPDRDWTDRESRILYRGRSIGRDYADWLAAKYGEDAIEREVKVEWAMGIGHIDVFMRETKTAIEVLSSKHASGDMIQRKLRQLVGYMESYPEAENGCLIILDPSDFSEERFPVAKDTDAYRSLVEQNAGLVAQLETWRTSHELPGRVCRKPGDSIGHFCRYADTCFAGWEQPKPETLVDDAEAIELAMRLAHAKTDEKAARANLSELEADRKTIEAALADHPGVDGVTGDIQIGPFVVTRTFTQRKPSLDTTKAELAGLLNMEALSEYLKPGASYWTTRIEQAGEVDPAIFGEKAPF